MQDFLFSCLNLFRYEVTFIQNQTYSRKVFERFMRYIFPIPFFDILYSLQWLCVIVCTGNWRRIVACTDRLKCWFSRLLSTRVVFVIPFPFRHKRTIYIYNFFLYSLNLYILFYKCKKHK